MAKLKLRGKDLRKLGYPSGKLSTMAMGIMKSHFKYHTKEAALEILQKVLVQPKAYVEDSVLGSLAKQLVQSTKPIEKNLNPQIALADTPINYSVYGLEGISENAQEQMDVAMRLPVAIGGALMPDAHHGYGLPIGGVLATENAVIPYGVGMDIGCRMCLSIYEVSGDYLEKNKYQLKKDLREHTRFGQKEHDLPMDDAVLERKEFSEIPLLRQLKNKAYRQIGTSGSGNHFVEFGIVQIDEHDDKVGLEYGQYLGLLSHSGSRGLGANVARHFTNLAMEQCRLPKAAKHLAWLDLSSEAGMEYWLAMNLAGDYASACHHHIHARLSKALGLQPVSRIENHHNFAWKEKSPDGKDLIVHRKGATPAGKGVLGIIPGSMTAPGFIVRGKGHEASFHSASHGAGRKMSRTKAKQSITQSALNKYLKSEGVELIGGGLDEAPLAYKDIHQVMNYQRNLIDVLGTFRPKIVRMAKP
ncbi:MAG: RtcB family protein [Bacteroidota bacterium]